MTRRNGLAVAVMVASGYLASLGLAMAFGHLRALLPLVPDALAKVAGS